MSKYRNDITYTTQPAVDFIPPELAGETPHRDERGLSSTGSAQGVYHEHYPGYQSHIGKVCVIRTFGSAKEQTVLIYNIRGSHNPKAYNYDPTPTSQYMVKIIILNLGAPDWYLEGRCEPRPDVDDPQELIWHMDRTEWITLGCGPPSVDNKISRISVLARTVFEHEELQAILRKGKYANPSAEEWHVAATVDIVPAVTNSKFPYYVNNNMQRHC